jgi:hypothetical protein
VSEPVIIDYPADRERLIAAFSAVTSQPEFAESVNRGKQALGIRGQSGAKKPLRKKRFPKKSS